MTAILVGKSVRLARSRPRWILKLHMLDSGGACINCAQEKTTDLVLIKIVGESSSLLYASHSLFTPRRSSVRRTSRCLHEQIEAAQSEPKLWNTQTFDFASSAPHSYPGLELFCRHSSTSAPHHLHHGHTFVCSGSDTDDVLFRVFTRSRQRTI